MSYFVRYYQVVHQSLRAFLMEVLFMGLIAFPHSSLSQEEAVGGTNKTEPSSKKRTLQIYTFAYSRKETEFEGIFGYSINRKKYYWKRNIFN